MSYYAVKRALNALAISTIDAAHSLVGHAPQSYVEASKAITTELMNISDVPEGDRDQRFYNVMNNRGKHIAWLLALDHRYPDADKLSQQAIELAGQALALEVRYDAAKDEIRDLDKIAGEFMFFRSRSSDAERDILEIIGRLDPSDKVRAELEKVAAILTKARIEFEKN